MLSRVCATLEGRHGLTTGDYPPRCKDAKQRPRPGGVPSAAKVIIGAGARKP